MPRPSRRSRSKPKSASPSNFPEQGKSAIRSQFEIDDAQRQELLERARLCAALTKPWILPASDQSANQKLPETYQSIVSRGITNMEGRMLLALYPPDMPWFKLEPAPEILYSPEISPEQLLEVKQKLFIRELLGQSVLESAEMMDDDRQRQSGFRSRKRMSLTQILVTGDVLEQLTDDYRIKVYRRDQYVTKRDSAMDILYHIVREELDPLALTEGQLEAAHLKKDELCCKKPSDRMVKLFTRIEWQPLTHKWLIEQEVNGHVINTSEEEISPYFATPFELVPGEHYGRGFIELNLGDLRTLNELELRILDFAAMASKLVPVIDQSSVIRPIDLAKKNGEPIIGEVVSGNVQKVAFLQTNKLADFNIVYQSATRKAKELAAAMLIESEVQPQKERVTAAQIGRIAAELEGALGGVYAPIADNQQLPLLRRLYWQLQRDGLLVPLPKGAVHIKALTGITALSTQAKSSRLMGVVQTVAAMGPEAMKRINVDALIDSIMRYQNVFEPGVIKDRAQVAREVMEGIAAQTAAAAGQRAVDVVGNAADGAVEQQQQMQMQQMAPPGEQV